MKIRTRLFLTNGVILTLLILIAGVMYQSTQSFISTSQWVTHTNEVIADANLRENTKQNEEQIWLKTNLAKLTDMLQGKRDLAEVASLILSELAPLVSSHHGAFYISEGIGKGKEMVLTLAAAYAYTERKHVNLDDLVEIVQIHQNLRLAGAVLQLPEPKGERPWP